MPISTLLTSDPATTMQSSGNQTRLVSIQAKSAKHAQQLFGAKTNSYGQVPFRATISGGCCDCLFPWFTIPEGFYATVQQFGQQINYKPPNGPETPVWPAGFHWRHKCCFSGIRELVTKQTVVFDTPVANVMTRDNISVQIDVCLQLRVCANADQNEDPKNLLRFIDNLGITSLMSQLKDAQAQSVRKMARTQTHLSVYGLRAMDTSGKLVNIDLKTLNDDDFGPESGMKIPQSEMAAFINENLSDDTAKVPEIDVGEAKSKSDTPLTAAAKEVELTEQFEGQKMVRASSDPDDPVMVDSTSSHGQERMTEMMLRNLNHQFNPFGIEITDLQIQNVILPPDIQRTVEAKTTVSTSKALEAMNQKYEMQRIDYENEIKLKDQEFGNEGEKIVEAGRRMVAEVNNRLARERAKTKQVVRQVEEMAKSKMSKIDADTNKAVAVLEANAKQLKALPKFVPSESEAKLLGGKELAGKEIVAGNAAQMVKDYTKGEITKKLADANLEVAKINAETDRTVATLNAETNRIRRLPVIKVSKKLAEQCGKPEWEDEEIQAENVAQMLTENAKADVESTEARAKLELLRAKASASKALYAAEEEASIALKDKRSFELAKQQVAVYQRLAENGKVSFFGTDSGSTVPNMVTIGGRTAGQGNSGEVGNGPWDTVRQLTESIAYRIASGK